MNDKPELRKIDGAEAKRIAGEIMRDHFVGLEPDAAGKVLVVMVAVWAASHRAVNPEQSIECRVEAITGLFQAVTELASRYGGLVDQRYGPKQ